MSAGFYLVNNNSTWVACLNLNKHHTVYLTTYAITVCGILFPLKLKTNPSTKSIILRTLQYRLFGQNQEASLFIVNVYISLSASVF